MNFRSTALSAASVAAAAILLTASPAQAAVVFLGKFSGNDCIGGFSTCYASQTGTVQGAGEGRSPSIFKWESDGDIEVSSLFSSIDGSEFDVDYVADTNTLSFEYDAGSNDPIIHYFAVKQANGYALFYDASPITGGSIALGSYFRQPGYSHITFFDTGSTPGVPEPSTWAMLLIGFAAIGGTLRSRKSLNGPRLRAA